VGSLTFIYGIFEPAATPMGNCRVDQTGLAEEVLHMSQLLTHTFDVFEQNILLSTDIQIII